MEREKKRLTLFLVYFLQLVWLHQTFSENNRFTVNFSLLLTNGSKFVTTLITHVMLGVLPLTLLRPAQMKQKSFRSRIRETDAQRLPFRWRNPYVCIHEKRSYGQVKIL